jgi:uncharacterized protein YjbI with pentapeptide repeats
MVQATAPQSTRWQEIVGIWRDNRWLFVIAGWLLGTLTFPFIQHIAGDAMGLLNNLVPEAVGIVFTVLILERLAENRDRENLKRQLIRNAGSNLRDIAVHAIDELRANRWLTWDDTDSILKKASLVGANLEKARLRAANLERADLGDANLERAFLVSANLRNAYLASANMKYADVQNADLQDADLYHVNLEGVDCYDTDFRGANLMEANLQGAYLDEAWFDTTTVLPDAVLLKDEQGNALRDSQGKHLFDKYWTPETDMKCYTDSEHPSFWRGYGLAGEDLSGRDFAHANLRGAYIVNANLMGANFQDANLFGADLKYCKLQKANLQKANLQNVRNIESARFSPETILPDGLLWTPDTDMTRYTDPNHPDFWQPEWAKGESE